MKLKQTKKIIWSVALATLLFVSSTQSFADTTVTSNESVNSSANTKVDSQVKENLDLYSQEGIDAFVGSYIEIYSHSKSINKDSVIEYQREDGSITSFKSTKEDSRDGEYYFLISPDTRGMWKIYSLNGQRIKNKKLNFMTYRDAEDFNKIMNADWILLNSKIKSKNVITKLYRYQGATRIETAINISKKDFSKSSSVIITNAWKQTDAIAASLLATELNAPILYTGQGSLNSGTRSEINRLGAKNIYIVGGTDSLNNSVSKDLKNIKTVESIKRISGTDRAATALELAKEVSKYKIGASAIIVSGESELDCLAVSAVSAENKLPMLYTRKGKLDNNSKKFIKNNFKGVFMIAGDGKISESLKNELISLGLKIKIKQGKNSDDLSLVLANDPAFYNNVKTIFLTSGKSSADGIPGSVLAAKKGLPLILIGGSDNYDGITNFVNNNDINSAYILGGVDSIS